MSYSIESSQNSCYPGTSVLINKLGIQNQEQLDENEALIVGVKTIQFELSPFSGPLDFPYYKRLHRFLFDELYDWAGTVRSIDLSKQRTRFCAADKIESLAEKMFGRVEAMNFFCDLSREDFIVELTDFYSGINYLHPFREGNGRTQRLYFRQLAQRAGYKLDFSAVDSDRMMIATIHAASGVEETLRNLFDEMIAPVEEGL